MVKASHYLWLDGLDERQYVQLTTYLNIPVINTIHVYKYLFIVINTYHHRYYVRYTVQS